MRGWEEIVSDVYLPEKSKYFTQVIYKESVLVTIQLVDFQIRGYIHVRPDDRILDELSREGKFLAVTEAVVVDTAGKLIQENEFMAVNREHVVWVAPIEAEENTGAEEVSQ
jgi:hypothetical protein